MKEEFDHTKIDLEQLLRTKSWDQLTATEQAEARKVVSDGEEYGRMFALMHQLKAVAGVHDAGMVPSSGVRENLLAAFEKELSKRRAAWWSGWWFRVSGALRFDIPVVRIGFAALVLIGGIVTVFNLMKEDEGGTVIVKQENTPSTVTPPEIPVTDNKIAVQPDQKGNETEPAPQGVSPEDNQQQVPVPLNDGSVVVDGNTPVVQDTNAKVFAMNPVDTSQMVVAPLTFNATNGTLCCATSNGTVLTTNGGVNHSWNLTGVAGNVNVGNVANGLPPRARALSNDAQVLDIFFALK